MKHKIFTVAVLVAGLAVVGCSKCPERTGYDKVPYQSRTAGTGTAVYGGNCAAPEPAPAVMKKAEPVFMEKQRK